MHAIHASAQEIHNAMTCVHITSAHLQLHAQVHEWVCERESVVDVVMPVASWRLTLQGTLDELCRQLHAAIVA